MPVDTLTSPSVDDAFDLDLKVIEVTTSFDAQKTQVTSTVVCSLGGICW